MKTEQALLVGVRRHLMSAQDMRSSLHELTELVSTAGAECVLTNSQDLKKPDPATFLGKGKVEEIALQVALREIDMVVVDDDLSPVQHRNLEEAWQVKVLDRTAIILAIFARRARTKEGKLQVELAQLEYMAPRLVGKGKSFSQQTGGIGTQGPGETQLEIDRRQIRTRVAFLQREIEKVRAHRGLHRKPRERIPLPLLSLVGHTNAGKSTLMNALTAAGVFTENKLFATLDPLARRLRLPSGREVLLADTVGFIQRLPHQLVDAFKATFEEIEFSHVILHVVDVSNSNYEQHMQVVEKVLAEMELQGKPKIVIFNKIDLVDIGGTTGRSPLRENHSPLYISSITGKGLPELLSGIDDLLRREFIHTAFLLPHEKGDILSQLYRISHVSKVNYQENGIYIECDVSEKYRSKWKEYVTQFRG